MTEEPYRWLEAVSNRRDYVREQLKGGSPVFAASLSDGILLLGVGSGQSKVFELFDRHALAGLGHPADMEKIRQAAIDAAHVEGFTRAPEDVSLRRLVGFGLGPQLKTGFEQIFQAPFLVELILAELADAPERDQLVRLRYDGTFQIQPGGLMVAAGNADLEAGATAHLRGLITTQTPMADAARAFLEVWFCLTNDKPLTTSRTELEAGWRAGVVGKTIELGWLNRRGQRAARYEALTAAGLGL